MIKCAVHATNRLYADEISRYYEGEFNKKKARIWTNTACDHHRLYATTEWIESYAAKWITLMLCILNSRSLSASRKRVVYVRTVYTL